MKVMIHYLKGTGSFEVKKFLTYSSIFRYLKKHGYKNVIIDFDVIKEDNVKCYVFVDNEDYEGGSK